MNIFNNDFKDFILYLNQYVVEYIVVGGYAVIIRGYSRSTGDIDIWVNKTEENFIKLQKAIKAFGLPEIANRILHPEFHFNFYLDNAGNILIVKINLQNEPIEIIKQTKE
jgi:predicted nucleotidyltransferase